MKEFFKKVNVFNILIAVALIVVGLFLICEPNTALLTICYVFGAVVMLFGVCSVVGYYLYGLEPFGFVSGICQLAIGLVIVCCAKQIVSPIVFAIFAGIVLLVSGLFKIQHSMDYRRIGVKYWWIYMLYSVMLVVLSIVLLANPFAGQRVLLIFLGVALLLDGIMKLVSMVVVKGKERKIKEMFNKRWTRIDDDVIDVENTLDK